MKKHTTRKVRIKIIGILIAMLITILTTGCSAGSTIDTTLIVNSDLSGTRKMNITISNDVFNEYFNGTIEDLNALITGSCPEAITWNYSEDQNTKQYNLEIAFSSPEDYRQKITSILGEEPSELVIQAPDTVWANGIYVKESFTDEELLRWMRDLMVNNGYVSSENAGKIFSTGTVEVVYQDETYRTNNRISVNQIDYVSIESINILTDINELDSFNREVQIVIPKNAMEKRGDDIRAYLANVIPPGASSEWEVNNSGASVFRVSADGLDAGGLEQFNRTVFGADTCTVTSADVSEYYSPFSFNRFITEELDLTQYLVGDYSSIYCTYQVKSPSMYKVYNSDNGSSFREGGWYSSESSKYLTLDDAYYGGDPLTFRMLVQKTYDVAGVDISTSKKMFGSDWEQTISFRTEDTPSEEEAAAIIATLQNRLNRSEKTTANASDTGADASAESAGAGTASPAGASDTETDSSTDSPEENSAKPVSGSVSISGEEANSGYCIRIKREGTLEEINASSQPLFGREEILHYAKDKGFSGVKKEEAFEERLYLDELLTNRTNDFEITYTLDLGMFTEGLYCSDDSAKIDGGKISVTVSDTNVSLQYVGTRTDLFALLFWVFLVIGCLSALLLLFKLGIFRAKPRQPQTVQPAPTAPAPVTSQDVVTVAATTATTPAVDPSSSGMAGYAAVDQSSSGMAGYAAVDPNPATTTGSVAEPAAVQNTAPSQPVKIIPKFCEKCGAPRQQTDLYCDNCGTKFGY